MRSYQTYIKLALAAILCTLLAACSYTKAAMTSPPLPHINQIALLPVQFVDHAKDRYVEYRTGQEILWQARRVLEAKSYQVVLVDDPALHSFTKPFQPENTTPEALAAMGPKTSDAVMLIRVDHFLDAAIYGGGGADGDVGGAGSGSIDIYATAQLVSRPENRIIWQNKGVGSDSDTGTSTLGLIEISTARDLIDNLLTPLPDNTP